MKFISKDTILKYSQTVGNRNQIDDIMTSILFIQRLFGYQILDPSWCWRRNVWNQIFSTCLTTYIVLGTNEVLSQTADVKLRAEAYYTFIVTMIFPLKNLLFVSQRRDFQKLYVMAKSDIFNLIKQNSLEKERMVLGKGKIVLKLFYVSISAPVLMYLLTAIFFYVIGKRVTLSKTTSILMPMTSPYYEIGLILHLVFLFEMAFMVLVIDMWFAFLMFMACLASDSLVQMLDVKQNRDETDEMYSIRLNDALKTFHIAHQKQTQYLNILNDMYKWSAIVPLLHVFLFTSLLLLLMSEGFDWAFASNILPLFCQIFVYNWFGEQIKVKVKNINTALLNFEWTRMKVRDMRRYFVIVTYMNKEFGIKTAVGKYLSLFTMTSVFKASYQMYTVLNTVKD